MNYTFVNVPTPKKKLPSHDGIEFESLSSYLEQAERLISHYCSNKNPRARSILFGNDDSVSLVAHALMMADWTYDVNNQSENGTATKKTYRYLRATWAMKTLLTKNRQQRLKSNLSLDMVFSDPSKVGNTSFLDFIEDISQGSPSSNLQTQELRAAIDEMLSLGIVTDTQREYLVLRYLKEMELEEIAAFKGVTRQAVYDGLKRATRFLQEGLNIK
jgi:RNA polymerase sigma factor (sigma-70 family)